jgi:hypothetical protein
LCFSDGSSKTASISRSAPLASAGLSVAVIRASTSSAASWVILPRDTALARSFSLYALPFCADSRETSLRMTSIPERADT